MGAAAGIVTFWLPLEIKSMGGGISTAMETVHDHGL
jgi:hypothetical protein